MADAVTTQVILNDVRNYVVKFTNVSDGTGESAVSKIPTTDLTSHAKLWTYAYDIKTMAVRLLWAGTPNQDLLILGGFANAIECGQFGGIPNNATTPTGAVLLTTIGAAANATYSIILHFKKAT